MHGNSLARLIARLVLAVAVVGLPQAGRAADAARARNVIIFIADGGGYNAFLAGSLYQHGRAGAQPQDGPQWVRYACRTSPQTSSSYSSGGSYSSSGAYSSNSYSSNSYSSAAAADDKGGYDPAAAWDVRPESSSNAKPRAYATLKSGYTDSAAAGTALATGAKTRNGRINTVESNSYISSSTKLTTIADLAKSLGKRTGVVTSVPISHATPASLGGAHSSSRENMRDLAYEMLSSGTLDLIMGAGHPEYDANGAPRRPTEEKDYDAVGGSFMWRLLRSGAHGRGWKLVETRAQFEALMSGPTPRRVMGVAPVAQTLQQKRQTRDWNGDGMVDAEDARVSPPGGDPPIRTVPSLKTMTRAALNVLSQGDEGFYLLVEGGAVDWAGHDRQPGRMVEEQVEFQHSIQAAIDWVEANSSWDQTLIVITADHETGLVWGLNSDAIAFEPLLNRGAGRAPGAWMNSSNHTNSLVPLYARGPGAEQLARRVVGFDPVRGEYVDNTTVFELMKAALTGEPMPERNTSSNTGGYDSSGGSAPAPAGESYYNRPAATQPTYQGGLNAEDDAIGLEEDGG